jgi:uncharacterized protein
MKLLVVFVACLLATLGMDGQTIGTFQSIQPLLQTEAFSIPPTHAFQVLVQVGDSLPGGGHMPIHPDFTGYVPIGGSSRNGYLSVSSEALPGGVTAFDIAFDSLTELWTLAGSRRVDFSALGDSNTAGTMRNCSGGLTPWGTVITCEELEDGADGNGDGYGDYGWAIEVDPAMGVVVDQDHDSLPDKLWAMGHFRHENAAVASDWQTVYEGADDFFHGFMFKFVADSVAQLGTGKLYVLALTDSVHGVWRQVPNVTQSERNRTLQLADSLGATNFTRIEDVEIGPDGYIYLASTAPGRIYRFKDQGMAVTHFDTFVDNAAFLIHHPLGATMVYFDACDNLAFDGEGNLWVLQDGSEGYIWVIGADHTAATPNLRIFGCSPFASEPTGITFSSDFKFMFLSLQHPYAGNSEPILDAAGNVVVFNRGATVVIGLTENMGTPVHPDFAGMEAGHLQLCELFPNPAADQIHFELETTAAGEAVIAVIEVTGRVTLRTHRLLEIGSSRIELDVAALPAGNYLLVVAHADGRVCRRFMKE